MDFEKSADQLEFNGVLPTVNARVAESKSKPSKSWGPLYVVGVFGCAFLLFHLYATTTFHHAAMDRGLHELEQEVHAMMEMYSTQANATPESVPLPVVDGGHSNHETLDDSHSYKRRHRGARRSRHQASEVVPVKRGGGATLTWFNPGLGACGGHNGDNDFIIAISHIIWNGGSHCGDTVTISYRGKSVQATVVDECMGCDPNHIDLSPGLLHHIAGPGTDMVSDASWSFGGAPPEEKPKPKPTPTSKPPPPTTTSKARPTSTSSTSTRASSTTKASSVASSTSSTTSASASQTPTYVDDGNVHNLLDFTVLLVNIGGVAMSGVLAKS